MGIDSLWEIIPDKMKFDLLFVDGECLQPIQLDSEALAGESCWLFLESCLYSWLHKRASCG